MFRDTPSQYKRHYGKNEGFAVWSLAFSICSFWFGLAGNGVRDMAWVALVMGILGVVFGVLCVTGKRQKKKDIAWLAIITSPIGIAVSLDALFWHWVSTSIEWP